MTSSGYTIRRVPIGLPTGLTVFTWAVYDGNEDCVALFFEERAARSYVGYLAGAEGRSSLLGWLARLGVGDLGKTGGVTEGCAMQRTFEVAVVICESCGAESLAVVSPRADFFACEACAEVTEFRRIFDEDDVADEFLQEYLIEQKIEGILLEEGGETDGPL